MTRRLSRTALPARGFTLIEVLTVVGIIALLAGIVAVAFSVVGRNAASRRTAVAMESLLGMQTEYTKAVTLPSQLRTSMVSAADLDNNAAPGINPTANIAMRMRGDPNVIMVGEMRDLETAEIAIRAALTGHLVFSTLHTNDAIGGISRLIDMGIEPFLIASSVRAFLAQRLVRRLCPECHQPAPAIHFWRMDSERQKYVLRQRYCRFPRWWPRCHGERGHLRFPA